MPSATASQNRQIDRPDLLGYKHILWCSVWEAQKTMANDDKGCTHANWPNVHHAVWLLDSPV